ncbi:hypothetical protein BaRGS_00016309 [Batillaria attramentaria]|uniref:Uncharacterized protein n=1 Tax=Batillaria attramentaria TaxID=370345 RepID=A0ABD0KZ92_9CAEN
MEVTREQLSRARSPCCDSSRLGRPSLDPVYARLQPAPSATACCTRLYPWRLVLSANHRHFYTSLIYTLATSPNQPELRKERGNQCRSLRCHAGGGLLTRGHWGL